MTSLILNPAILFCLVWGSTLFLYSLKYSELLTDLEVRTVILVVGSCLGALAGWLFSRIFARQLIVSPVRSATPWANRTKAILATRLRWFFFVWLALVLFEFASFGNLPFLSLLGIGAPVLYTEYGFSGLHGLLNAMQLAMFDMALIFYIRTGSRRYAFYAVALVVWSVLMVTRAMIMASIVQGIFIGLLFSASFRRRFMLLGSSVVLAVVLAFGALGDLRSSGGSAIQDVGQQSSEYPDFLPAGFFWVYVYVTTPLNNINANIHSIPTTGFPYYSILPLIPNVLRDALAVEDLDVSLVEESLNVSSFYRQFLSDYGVYGTIFAVMLLYFAFSVAMAKSKRDELWSLVLVVILFCTVLSVFVNAYTAIIYVMEMLVFKALYFRATPARRRLAPASKPPTSRVAPVGAVNA
ncbi:MAG TPA: O-antigen polymerase [Caldimonas sp.]|jgi:oligosaccharide repeat unit polymerase|nr:O-antigen polymerase [Caldimonas sp.]